uniref:alanine transaminase n=1 Tax=Salarias fasciatus TaxID=181472 RepID=A0A672IX05_SALFA
NQKHPTKNSGCENQTLLGEGWTELRREQTVVPKISQSKPFFCCIISANSKSVTASQICSHTLRCELCADVRISACPQGAAKPYKDVINVSWGDPHRGGLKPLTFVRQVLAACFYPELLDSSKLPLDAKQRAEWLLERCEGSSVGCYTSTAGISDVVHRVSEFIRRRDGGVPSHPKNIFITCGSQWALTNILKILVDSEASPRAGVLVPAPGHSTTVWSVTGQGAVVVPYYLCEEEGWALKVEELQRALDSAEGVCKPVALYVINPGNPAGLVQSRESMEEVIRFASEKKLFLLADEVYQDYIYGEGSRFISYKKVVAEMGAPLSDSVQLASFHSASKGMMGECGLRGGYVELLNLDPAVMEYVYKIFSIGSCGSVSGQLALDIMSSPPQPGDSSYPLYEQHIRSTLVHNVKTASEVLNRLPGLSCQPGDGGAFLFPRVDIPPKAIQRAQVTETQKPDTFYCVKLLEEAGVLVSPGCDFTQKEGTHHIRLCTLVCSDVFEELLRRLSNFQTNFMKDFS